MIELQWYYQLIFNKKIELTYARKLYFLKKIVQAPFQVKKIELQKFSKITQWKGSSLTLKIIEKKF